MREFTVALETQTVTFHEIARAWFGMQCNDDEALQQQYCEMYGKLLESFERPRGGIITSYCAENLPLAVALTEVDAKAESDTSPQSSGGNGLGGQGVCTWEQSSGSGVHVESLFGYPVEVDAVKILWHCQVLDHRSIEYLPLDLRKIVAREIYSIIAALFGLLDWQAAQRTSSVKESATVRQPLRELAWRVNNVQHFYEANVRQRALWRFFLGMFLTTIPIIGAYLVLTIVGDIRAKDALAVSVVAGTTGAVVSAMERMSRDKLDVVPEIGKRNLCLLGSIRPLLGAVFGALTFVVIEGGLLTAGTAPSSSPSRYLYYAGLAFAAGFTERAVTFTERIAQMLGPASTKDQGEPQAPMDGRAGGQAVTGDLSVQGNGRLPTGR